MAADVPQPARIQISRPRWGGQPLEGRPILLHYEQGLGDTLQFIRFARQVKERGGRGVGFLPAAHASARVALRRGRPRVRRHRRISRFSGTGRPDERAQHPGHDGRTHSPAIPTSARTRRPIDFWRPEVARALGVADLNSVFKIGIAWQGSPKNHIDRWRCSRSPTLPDFPDCREFVCSACKRRMDSTSWRPARISSRSRCIDPKIDERRDFLDTAALMQSCRPRRDPGNRRRPPRGQVWACAPGSQSPRSATGAGWSAVTPAPGIPASASSGRPVMAIGMASFARLRSSSPRSSIPGNEKQLGTTKLVAKTRISAVNCTRGVSIITNPTSGESSSDTTS